MSFEDNPADNENYQLDLCIQEIKELQSQIAALTAERDEARREKESQFLEFTKQIMGNSARDEMQNLRDAETIESLTAELVTLKSAPGMEEVDAILKRASSPDCNGDSTFQALYRDQLADLARRSIAARDEVVGKLSNTERLIRWMVKHWDWTGKMESLAEGCVIEPWKENAAQVLVICSKESDHA